MTNKKVSRCLSEAVIDKSCDESSIMAAGQACRDIYEHIIYTTYVHIVVSVHK